MLLGNGGFTRGGLDSLSNIFWQSISHMLVALLLFLARFFESKPKTTRSDELAKEKTGSPGKKSPEQDSSLGSGDR